MGRKMKNESSPGLVALLERHGFIATGNVNEDLAIARLIMPAPYKDGYDKNTLVKRSIDRVDCDKNRVISRRSFKRNQE